MTSVVVLALTAVIALVLPVDTPSSSSPATSATVISPTPSPGLTNLADQLIARVPTAVRGSCVAEAPASPSPAGLKASIVCPQPPYPAISAIWYEEYVDSKSMNAAFSQRANFDNVVGLAKCTKAGRGSWNYEGESGSVICYPADVGKVIAWTIDQADIIILAKTPSLDFPEFYAWWETSSLEPR